MKKFLLTLSITSMFLILLGIGKPVMAGDVDVLIKKLVEKGILSESDAKGIVKEIQKESGKEEERVKDVAAETAKEVVKKEVEKGSFEVPQWVKKIRPFGDLRLRHDTQWKGDNRRNPPFGHWCSRLYGESHDQ